jgi:iron(III) transport system ATP-binding protein
MSRAASVRFEKVSRLYGDVRAVNEVSFEVQAGTLVTLLGPSGCGKTTTLRLVAGLEQASSGKIFIGDEDVTALGAAERDVSMVFQSYALFPHMNVLDNVMYGPLASGAKKAEAKDMALEKLALVGLKGFEGRLPSELSGGQQQRVALARAIVLEPRVLLFDEPLSNLDARLRRKVRDDIRDLQQRLGLTVLYVTHDQQEALAVSDKVIVMDNAVIAQQGTPHDLYERPQSRFLADFIGESNIIEGRFSTAGSDTLFTAGGVTIPLGVVAFRPEDKMIAVRPDRIKVVAGGDGSIKVRRRAYVGHAWEYSLNTPWKGELLAIAPARHELVDVGASVALSIEPGSAIPLGR